MVGALLCGVAVTWAAAGFGLRLVYYGPHCGGGVKVSRDRVRDIAFAATLHYVDNDLRCPDRDDLVGGELVSRKDLVDAWGTSITFRCIPDGGGVVVVRSAGPDHLFHTDDDITNGDR
jgi:hypothetical protein